MPAQQSHCRPMADTPPAFRNPVLPEPPDDFRVLGADQRIEYRRRIVRVLTCCGQSDAVRARAFTMLIECDHCLWASRVANLDSANPDASGHAEK